MPSDTCKNRGPEHSPRGPEPPGRSVAWLCQASPAERTPFLNMLVPPGFLHYWRLPIPTHWAQDGTGVFRADLLPGNRAIRLEIWPDPQAEDPALSLEIGDTHRGHLEAGWIVLNDITGPRFRVDCSRDGTPLALGGPERNQDEELRALAAGLAPNQVRPGLRLFRALIKQLEGLVHTLGKERLYVVPLAYHNAIIYERYGFEYADSEEELHWIQRNFQPGGFLRRRMDGSRPFRQPWMADTIRGRSWAIRDGVLDRLWMTPHMFKQVGRPGSVDTFPGGRW